MIWATRTLQSLPFAVALVLTVLIAFADRVHIRLERVAGYGLLFATPSAWLVDRLWMPNFHNRWIETMLGYLISLTWQISSDQTPRERIPCLLQ